jgi:uncharacterized protein (DUF1778 family)
MPRYRREYTGERRTTSVNFQLTPSERALIEEAATNAGARLSEYVRELCLRRSTAASVVAGARRNPEARALVRELTAIGNNLNQLTRLANTVQAIPHLHELHLTTGLLKAALARAIAL